MDKTLAEQLQSAADTHDVKGQQLDDLLRYAASVLLSEKAIPALPMDVIFDGNVDEVKVTPTPVPFPIIARVNEPDNIGHARARQHEADLVR